MSGLEGFLAMLQLHPYIFSFVGAMINEELAIFNAFLSGHGAIPFWIVYLYTIAGILFIDTIWFLFGRSKFIKHFYTLKKKSSKIRDTLVWIDKKERKNIFLTLFMTKFVYGTRAIMDIYLGSKKMRFVKFFLYDLAAVLIWASIFIPLGWLAGQGLWVSLHIVKDIEKVIALGIVFVVVIHVIMSLVHKKVFNHHH